MARELIDAAGAARMLGLKFKTGVHHFAAIGKIKIAQKIPFNKGRQTKYLFFRDDIEAFVRERDFNKTHEGRSKAAAKGHLTRIDEVPCAFDNRLALRFICGQESIKPHKRSAKTIRIGEENE